MVLTLTGTSGALPHCHYHSTRLEEELCHRHAFGILITCGDTPDALKPGINSLSAARRTHPALLYPITEEPIYMRNDTFCIAIATNNAGANASHGLLARQQLVYDPLEIPRTAGTLPAAWLWPVLITPYKHSTVQRPHPFAATSERTHNAL
jgi:hypothetical protein